MVKRFVNLMTLCAMISPFLLTSCQKDLYDSTRTVVSEEPSELDFSTTQNVQFDLNYNVPTGYVAAFDLYTENPCEEGTNNIILKEGVKPIGSGISVSGKFNNTKVFPGFVTELYAYSTNLFVNKLMYAKIENGKAKFEVVDTPVAAASSMFATTRNASNGTSDYYLGQHGNKADVDAVNRPNYIDTNKKVEITNELISKINNVFKPNTPVESKFLQDASLYLEKDAEIWVCVLVTDAALTNELRYFCYNGPKGQLATLSTAERAAIPLISAFPQANLSKIANQGLQRGEYVKLKYLDSNNVFHDTFPAGTTVGWGIRGYLNGSTPTFSGNLCQFWSTPAWNFEKTEVGRNHTAFFNAGTSAEPFVCFGFEDLPAESGWHYYLDVDCNDLIFNVQLNPIDALDPPPTIDEEPEDVYASQEYKGYLGYEDYWPIFFDYDLNDLLVKYHSTVNTKTQSGKNADTNVYVTTIEDDYTMVFTGANFHNKFSVIMPFSKSLVKKATLIDVQEDTQEDITSKLITDGDGFIVDICPDAAAVITQYDRNTAPYRYRVSIELNSKAMKMSDFENNNWEAPYNPFITPIENKFARTGDIEVHLPGYRPSQRAAAKWFGTNDDRSNLDLGIYYVGGDTFYNKADETEEKNIFPFAIHLSGVEDLYIPDEKVRIDRTFPQYKDWILSGKTENKDWYLHPWK